MLAVSDPPKSAGFRSRWRAVLILGAIYAFAMADRNILAMLIGPLRQEMGFGDFYAGLLLGPAFAVTYVCCSFPLGFMVDRLSRRWVIFAGLLIWMLATVASGFAGSVITLLVLRAFVGVGEASVSPTAHSLLGDLFRKEERSAPLSVYQAGAPLGAGLALFAAGLILDWHARGGVILGFSGEPMAGWRLVFLGVGLPGVLLLALPLLLPEPRRTRVRKAEPPPALKFTAFFAENARILITIFVMFAFSIMVVTAHVAWTAEFLRRGFQWSDTRIGFTVGTIDLLFPILSHLATGFIADRMSARGWTDAPLRLMLIMVSVALPFAVLKFLTDSPVVFLISACGYALLFAPTLALVASALQQFTPTELRGRVSGSFLAFTGFVGMTLGPVIPGAITQFGFGDDDSLGLALAGLTVVGVGMVILMLLLALKAMRDAVERQRLRELP